MSRPRETEHVKELHQMFPELGEEVISVVYAEKGNDLEKTVNALLGMNETCLPKPKQTVSQRKKAAKQRRNRRRELRRRKVLAARKSKGGTTWVPLEVEWPVKGSPWSPLPTAPDVSGGGEADPVDLPLHHETDETKEEKQVEEKTPQQTSASDMLEDTSQRSEETQTAGEATEPLVQGENTGALKHEEDQAEPLSLPCHPDEIVFVKLFIQGASEFRRFRSAVKDVLATAAACVNEAPGGSENPFRIVYTDEEGDKITIAEEEDVHEALCVHKEFIWPEDKPSQHVLRLIALHS